MQADLTTESARTKILVRVVSTGEETVDAKALMEVTKKKKLDTFWEVGAAKQPTRLTFSRA